MVRRVHQGWTPAELSRLIDGITEASNLTQRRLAALAEVHHSQISRWKSGEHQPAYDKITRLAAAIARDYPELAGEAAQLPGAAGYGTVADLRPAIVRSYWQDPAIGPAVRGIWGADGRYVSQAQKVAMIRRLARMLRNGGSGDIPAAGGP
jgi:transcriptional regulator with XRE-family HTH domain